MDLKKTTEVVAIGSVLAVTLLTQAHAAGTSIAATATAQPQAIAAGAANSYVVTAFTLNISANTSLAYDGNTTQVAINTANSKGMHTFGGSSQGGSVSACQTTSVQTPAANASLSLTNGC